MMRRSAKLVVDVRPAGEVWLDRPRGKAQRTRARDAGGARRSRGPARADAQTRFIVVRGAGDRYSRRVATSSTGRRRTREQTEKMTDEATATGCDSPVRGPGHRIRQRRCARRRCGASGRVRHACSRCARAHRLHSCDAGDHPGVGRCHRLVQAGRAGAGDAHDGALRLLDADSAIAIGAGRRERRGRGRSLELSFSRCASARRRCSGRSSRRSRQIEVRSRRSAHRAIEPSLGWRRHDHSAAPARALLRIAPRRTIGSAAACPRRGRRWRLG